MVTEDPGKQNHVGLEYAQLETESFLFQEEREKEYLKATSGCCHWGPHTSLFRPSGHTMSFGGASTEDNRCFFLRRSQKSHLMSHWLKLGLEPTPAPLSVGECVWERWSVLTGLSRWQPLLDWGWGWFPQPHPCDTQGPIRKGKGQWTLLQSFPPSILPDSPLSTMLNNSRTFKLW